MCAYFTSAQEGCLIMKRARPTDFASQRSGLEKVAVIFRIDENQTRLERQKSLEMLEAEHHLSDLAMQTTESCLTKLNGGKSNAGIIEIRTTSLACRVLAWMCESMVTRDVADLLVRRSAVSVCLRVLRQIDSDPSCCRSCLSLIAALCKRARSNLGREQLRRSPHVAETLCRVIRKWREHAPTIELAVAASAYMGEFAVSSLCKEVLLAGSTHPTDAAVVKSSLSACASFSFLSERNRRSLSIAGVFGFVRACLEYRPAHDEISCLAVMVVANVMQSSEARKRFEYKGSDNRRLTTLICSLVPRPSSFDNGSQVVDLHRAVVSALALMSLSGEDIRHFIQKDCGVGQLLQDILDGDMPSIRLRLDTEFCLAAVSGNFDEIDLGAFQGPKGSGSLDDPFDKSDSGATMVQGTQSEVAKGYLESHTGRKMHYLPRPTSQSRSQVLRENNH